MLYLESGKKVNRAFLDGMKEAAVQEMQTIDVIDKHIEFCCGALPAMLKNLVDRNNDPK